MFEKLMKLIIVLIVAFIAWSMFGERFMASFGGSMVTLPEIPTINMQNLNQAGDVEVSVPSINVEGVGEVYDMQPTQPAQPTPEPIPTAVPLPTLPPMPTFEPQVIDNMNRAMEERGFEERWETVPTPETQPIPQSIIDTVNENLGTNYEEIPKGNGDIFKGNPPTGNPPKKCVPLLPQWLGGC